MLSLNARPCSPNTEYGFVSRIVCRFICQCSVHLSILKNALTLLYWEHKQFQIHCYFLTKICSKVWRSFYLRFRSWQMWWLIWLMMYWHWLFFSSLLFCTCCYNRYFYYIYLSNLKTSTIRQVKHFCYIWKILKQTSICMLFWIYFCKTLSIWSNCLILQMKYSIFTGDNKP